MNRFLSCRWTRFVDEFVVQPPKKMKPGVLTLALRQLFFRLSQRLNIFGNCMIFFTIFAKGRVTGGDFIYTGASVSRDSLAFNQKVIKRRGTATFKAVGPDWSTRRRGEASF